MSEADLGVLKRLELWGRRCLIRLMALILGARQRPVDLPETPKVLVVRLDERLGNLVMLTPLLASLKAGLPNAQVDVLCSEGGREILERHPAVDRFVPYNKKALWAPHGPLRTPYLLRQQRYDLCIDATNPTDPSSTQTIMTRMSGATHTVGPGHGRFASLYTSPAPINPVGHEIELRLQLLAPIPGVSETRRMVLELFGRGCVPESGDGSWSMARKDDEEEDKASAAEEKPSHGQGDQEKAVLHFCQVGLEPHGTPSSPVENMLLALRDESYAVLNIGARTQAKRMNAAAYAEVASDLLEYFGQVILTYGPAEHRLAEATHEAAQAAVLAPPTSVTDLHYVFSGARIVASCDTGPMHLSVALGTPTCGIFVTTDPKRYGYPNPPHTVVDARGGWNQATRANLNAWLARTSSLMHEIADPGTNTT